MSNPDNRKYVQDYLKQNGDRFLSSMGKMYTPEKVEELLGMTTSVPAPSVDQDLDDIFKPV